LTNLSVDPDLERVNTPVEIGVFRIIQEALQNVRKHSRAEKVDVTVSRQESTLTVVIQDDGVGFDQSTAPGNGTHFGLVSMSERARLLHGELVLHSVPGRGTRVMLAVPLNEFTGDM